jgi:glutathione S-transferase
MTLKIYGIGASRAMRCMWLADELAIPFQQIELAWGESGTKSAAFKKINPMGEVPAIEDDGFVLWESLAINLYLAKKQGGPLAPATLQEDALMTMWSFWAATAIEPRAIEVYYNRVFYPPAERNEAAVQASLKSLAEPLSVLDQRLAGGHLVGGRFTVADLNVAAIVFYLTAVPEALDPYPRVMSWFQAIAQRPAWKAAIKRRG